MEFEIASRTDRFFAAMVDVLIVLIPSALISIFMIFVLGLTFDVENQVVDPAFYIVGPAFSYGLYFLLNYRKLRDNGQTIGKQAFGIKIVDLEGRQMHIKNIVIKRLIPYWFFPVVPYIGGLLNIVNILFILGKPKRCLHDYIAGSKVISVNKAGQAGIS